ncbi:GGDEF domain-containing protein [Candidatus Magnetomoraceae bacterium gMMP-15]
MNIIMKEKQRFIIVIGVPSIKKYVFATDRLVEIRGASTLLDDLVINETKKFLINKFGQSNVDCVFVGGGSGQFIINAEENEIENRIYELEGLFANKSKGALRLICGKAELSDDNYHDALEQAFYETERKKEELPIISSTQLHTGYISECKSCSQMASIFDNYDDKKLLCDVCYEKVKNGYEARKGHWGKFAEYLQMQGISEEESYSYRSKDFEEIGERCKVREGYTALVYADGNAMGKLIKSIQNQNQFKFFSETVETSIREACHEALFANCKPVNGKIPGEILLLGGDDLLVYLSAEAAFPFAINAAKLFTEKTKQKFASYTTDTFFSDKLNNRGLTISFGIVYGKTHTPFSMLLNQAEELLQSAKKAGSKDSRPEDYYSPTYIDYHIASSFNQLSVKDCRENHMVKDTNKDKIKLYQKPYSLEQVELLLKHARNLVNSNIPNTRLKRLGYAPNLGKVNGTLECLKLIMGTGTTKQQHVIIDALRDFDCATILPWNKSKNKDNDDCDTTMLVDLIEIANFCSKQ